MTIDHDQVALNGLIDWMFAESIMKLIPGIMASEIPGVAWAASTCLLDSEWAFRIVGRFETVDGREVGGEFVISQRVILDGEGAGENWVKKCKVAVRKQLADQILDQSRSIGQRGA